MTRGCKEKPVPSELGTGQFASLANAGQISLNVPEEEIKFWADVLDSLVGELAERTRSAITAVVAEAGPGNEPSIARILHAAKVAGARAAPVAAYWGWLHPAANDASGFPIGPDQANWKSIFDHAAPPPVLPMDDYETLSVLGLCRASHADSEVAPVFLVWPNDPETWAFPEEYA